MRLDKRRRSVHHPFTDAFGEQGRNAVRMGTSTKSIVRAIRRSPVAWLALFVALGGTSFAASRYLITSTSQIKPTVLRKLRGATGPPGPAGPAGPPGPAATIYSLSPKRLTTVNSPGVTVPPGAVQSATAVCPAGTRAISGGGSGGITDINISEIQSARLGWFIVVVNPTRINVQIHAQAECSAAGQAVAAGGPLDAWAQTQREADRAASRLRTELLASRR